MASFRASPAVRRIIISHGLTGFVCWYGVEKVFLTHIGITALGISQLSIAYILTSAVCNVPTGILADKFGRKYAVLLAAVALFVSTAIATQAHSFTVYLFSAMLWGVFYTTQNGAYEALLYDTLKDENNEADYQRLSGLNNAALWSSVFVASLLGAWVGNRYGLRTAFYITLIPNALNILAVLRISEPSKHIQEGHSSFKMIRQSGSFLVSSPKTIMLGALFLFVSLLTWILNEYGQLFFLQLAFSTIIIGLLTGLGGLFQAAGNAISHRTSHLPMFVGVTIAFVLYMITFTVPTPLRVVAIVLFMTVATIKSVVYIGAQTELQHSIPQHIRATTLSSLGMLNDMLLVTAFLLFGLVANAHGARSAFLAVGAYGLLLLIAAKLYSILRKYPTIHPIQYQTVEKLVTDEVPLR